MAYRLNKLPLIHPGQVLKGFIEDYGLTEYRLAKDINVSPRRINEITHGKRAVTVDTALRLAAYFGNSRQFWLNAQQTFELARAAEQRLPERISKEVRRVTG